MLRILLPIFSLLLLGLVAFAGHAALQACTLNAPFLARWLPQNCRGEAEQAALLRLSALRAEHATLLRDIREKENELGKIQCVADHPEPPPIVLPAPTPEPPPPPPRDETTIDEDAWRNRDLAVLDGCWELETNMRVTNIQTGKVSHYTEWTMCFDANGAGTQNMSATNGATCNGTVSGRFLDDGQLRIDEPGDLPCSDGMDILRRVGTCTLSGDGTARCNLYQPERGGRDTVRLRRATRN